MPLDTATLTRPAFDQATYQAERDYCAIERPWGVRKADVERDIIALQNIASELLDLLKRAKRNAPSSEAVNAVPFNAERMAVEMTDSLADGLGLSREAHELLNAYVREYA